MRLLSMAGFLCQLCFGGVLLSGLSLSWATSTTASCNCEKIKTQEKCAYELDCIQICGLHDWSQKIQDKLCKECSTNRCLKNGISAKTFPLESMQVLSLQSSLKKVKKNIKSLEEENKKKVIQNCPGCGLYS